MTPPPSDRRLTALHRATTPRRALPSHFTHRTLQRIEARRQATERRNQRLLAVAAALAVAGAFAFLGWMFGPVSIPPLTVSVPTLSVPHIDADSLKPWLPLFPVFILLFAFDWWLSRRRRSH